MISRLSELIGLMSFKLAEYIILLFPFTEVYLSEKPELIMLIVGFGGQGLFASRFLIQWISSAVSYTHLRANETREDRGWAR